MNVDLLDQALAARSSEWPSKEWIEKKRDYAKTLSLDSLLWAIKDCFLAAGAMPLQNGPKYAHEALIYTNEYRFRHGKELIPFEF